MQTQKKCCCIFQFFKTRSIQFSSLDTLSCSGFSAQKKKQKNKKKLSASVSYSLAHSDSRCCILMCVSLRGPRWGSPLPLLSAHQLGRGKGYSSQTDGTVTPCSHTQAHTLTHTQNGVTVSRKSLARKTTRFLIERGKKRGEGDIKSERERVVLS